MDGIHRQSSPSSSLSIVPILILSRPLSLSLSQFSVQGIPIDFAPNTVATATYSVASVGMYSPLTATRRSDIGTSAGSGTGNGRTTTRGRRAAATVTAATAAGARLEASLAEASLCQSTCPIELLSTDSVSLIVTAWPPSSVDWREISSPRGVAVLGPWGT